MPGLFDALNVARSGMSMHQKSMEVTGNNVANVNTPGYSKQTAEAKGLPSLGAEGLTFGQGVNVEEISREEDIFIEDQLRAAEERNGRASAKSTPLKEMEQIFGVDTGNLADKMDEFFASWQELSKNPGGEVERTQVMEKGKQVVSAFKEITNEVNRVEKNINASLRDETTTINGQLKEVAELNSKIASARAQGREANTELDQRELLLRDLSQKLGVNTYKGKNDMASVTLPSGQVLVQGEQANQLQEDNGNIFVDNGKMRTQVGQGDVGGEFAGFMEVRDQFIPQVESRVATLQHDLVTQVNSQHQRGTGLDGITGRSFFTQQRFVHNDSSIDKPGTAVDTDVLDGSTDMTVQVGTDTQTISFDGGDDANGDGQLSLQEAVDAINKKETVGVQASVWHEGGDDYRLSLASKDKSEDATVTDATNMDNISYASPNPEKNAGSYEMAVAVSDTKEIAAGFSDSPGDNRNAQAMADLVEEKKVNGEYTFRDYYSQISSDVGMEVSQNETLKGSTGDNLTQLKNQRDSLEGVSLKQAMMNMTRFQKGFQASARVMSTVDEMLQTLMGVVR
jgi:flagellar hook-associated protein 1 FlgK